MRLIDVEELKNDMAVLLERNKKLIDPWLANAVDDTIEEQAVIEAEPVRRGRWIRQADQWFCSACGEPDCFAYLDGHTLQDRYCPHCGARMEQTV